MLEYRKTNTTTKNRYGSLKESNLKIHILPDVTGPFLMFHGFIDRKKCTS